MSAEQTALKQTENMNKDYNYKNLADAIRFLTLDAVKKANSGHSGTAMALADIASVLFSKFMVFDPQNPEWPNRDRFILSAGHASMLLYSLGYLLGYKEMNLEEIKNFRQIGSLTPGHPEVEFAHGIETTTGPLGQGIGNSVGFALAERILNARFGDDLMSHYTYVIAGDGDLMEGISHEACALAGHLKLSKLIVFYDDNGVTIDGKTDLTYSDNVPQRFEAYGWDTQTIDGHDLDAIEAAITAARESDKPSIICCKTKIGFGVPAQEFQPSAHGAITGDSDIAAARENLGWTHEPFVIPEEIVNDWREIGAQSASIYQEWAQKLASHPKKQEFETSFGDGLPANFSDLIREVKTDCANAKPDQATRKASGKVLEKLIPAIPEMVGGSADLTGSNNTKTPDSKVINAQDYAGNYINYGVREHGMAAAMNGLALHGGIIPYGGTFLIFSDYCRPSIRLSALMKQRVVYVMTHDSIGVGEDGPTHQPVEQVASIRAIPGAYLFRPCDGIETAEAWELALKNQDAPSVLALTRQNLPTVCEDRSENMVSKGAYILRQTSDTPKVTLFASGSEVSLALQAFDKLTADGVDVRIVSVPCMELFFEQDGDYFQKLVCNDSIKIGIEAGVRQGWDRIIGGHSIFIGMDSFGASAPCNDVFNHFDITAEAIIKAVQKKL